MNEGELPAELLDRAYRRMAVGSKSFYFAAWFLKRQQRDAICLLYSWCRYCDDAIDDLPADASLAQRKLALDDLRTRTTIALTAQVPVDQDQRSTQDTSKTGPQPFASLDQKCQLTRDVFVGLAYLQSSRAIPEVYFQDLLDGMAMDVEGHQYEDLEDLKVYCYRVAGVVGVIFCYIFGVRDTVVHGRAIALGIAMQMTNIARDVGADFELGRVYLPSQWCKRLGINTVHLLTDAEAPNTLKVVCKLVEVSRQFYRSSELGLRFLPWRAALAVGIARFVYGAIGEQVVVRGRNALRHRVIIPSRTKVFLALRGLWLAVRQRHWWYGFRSGDKALAQLPLQGHLSRAKLLGLDSRPRDLASYHRVTEPLRHGHLKNCHFRPCHLKHRHLKHREQ